MNLFTFCFLYFSSIKFCNLASPSSCPSISLRHGNVKYIDSGSKAKLKCNRPYLLIGDEVVVCNNGTWSSAFNVCARKDCPKLPKILHGDLIVTKKAFAEPICDKNFILIGSPSIYCNEERQWNDTLPQCMANEMERYKPCHFELEDPSHCRWLLNPSVYKWIVHSPMEDDEPFDVDYPLFDHTANSSDGGHFLLLVRSSSFIYRKADKEAEFISPLLPATAKSNETLCLVFYSYIFGPHSGSLKVLINDEIVWRNSAYNEKDYKTWKQIKIDLRYQHQQFRIILTGRTSVAETPGIAIDDLELLTGDKCNFTTESNSTRTSSTERTRDVSVNTTPNDVNTRTDKITDSTDSRSKNAQTSTVKGIVSTTASILPSKPTSKLSTEKNLTVIATTSKAEISSLPATIANTQVVFSSSTIKTKDGKTTTPVASTTSSPRRTSVDENASWTKRTPTQAVIVTTTTTTTTTFHSSTTPLPSSTQSQTSNHTVPTSTDKSNTTTMTELSEEVPYWDEFKPPPNDGYEYEYYGDSIVPQRHTYEDNHHGYYNHPNVAPHDYYDSPDDEEPRHEESGSQFKVAEEEATPDHSLTSTNETNIDHTRGSNSAFHFISASAFVGIAFLVGFVVFTKMRRRLNNDGDDESRVNFVSEGDSETAISMNLIRVRPPIVRPRE